MTSSILNTLCVELVDNIKQADKQMFVTMILKQMGETQKLYEHLYTSNVITEKENTFVISSTANDSDLHIEFTDSAYLLHSVCYLGYDLLTGEINYHLLNSLLLVKKCVGKMVEIIEEINLRKFPGFTPANSDCE
ncbi:MAG: hypothetical protein K2Q14_06105 [Gammaproteobacteria bacterium]|nr:hypothetical protein [Gammaproteobacteria bacterium]